MKVPTRAIAFLSALLFAGSALAEVRLPPEAQCYFDAVAAKDAAAVGACMAEDAMVLDLDRTIEGRAALAGVRRAISGGMHDYSRIELGSALRAHPARRHNPPPRSS